MAWHDETITIYGGETGFEREVEALFEVLWHEGCPMSHDDPGEAAHGEVTEVKIRGLDGGWAVLRREHWAERMIYDALQDHVDNYPEHYKPGDDQ